MKLNDAQRNSLIEYVEALFGTATEKAQESAFPVGNCKVCGELVAPYNKHAKYEGGYTCQPAPPELSKVCPNCQKPEEEPHFAGNLTGDGGWYFCPGRVPKAVEDHQRPQSAQPVAVGMTEALRMILDVAESRAEDQRHDGLLECSRNLERAIAAVRQQAAHRQRPKLEKVRGALSWLKMQYEPGSQGYTPNATVWKMTEAALAELDDAEGKRRE